MTSDRVDKLDAAAEVFYRRLMSVVDDYGRFDARPSVLRPVCYPLRIDKVREADISRWLAACEAAGLIVLYEIVDNSVTPPVTKPYLVLLNVEKPRADSSKYPDPPKHPALSCARMRADGPYSYSSSSSSSIPSPSSSSAAPAGGREGKVERLTKEISNRRPRHASSESH